MVAQMKVDIKAEEDRKIFEAIGRIIGETVAKGCLLVWGKVKIKKRMRK